MAQGRGNGRQDNQNRGQQMSQNERISAGEKLNGVLAALEEREEELAAVLPNDVPVKAFLALVNQALRANPKLLRCTGDSIINACVKAAYDGLRIDGKEAAIVDSKESYKEGNVWKERDVARYMPMVFGLIKQILQSGAALSVKAVIAYQNEARVGRFTLLEGTTPGIHHQPFVEGEDRGDPIGCYAIAEIKPGVFKHEWMDRIAILDVQKESKTDKVWNRWPTEMWKKTVIRRLRKSLNGTSQIRDMEAADMFPQFDRSQPHPELASLPARPRPTRRQDALEHKPMESFDIGTGEILDGREKVAVDRGEERQQGKQQAKPQERRDPPREEPQLPADDIEWGVWGTEIEAKIKKCASLETLTALNQQIQPVLKHAKQAIRDRMAEKFTDRAADIAAGPDDGAAADDSGDDTAAGESK